MQIPLMIKIINLFIRKTNSKTFIPEIDGLRFFAIITVVLFHLNTAYSEATNVNFTEITSTASFLSFGWWIIRGDLGVKVFFAISGFILALPFLKHYISGTPKIQLKEYYLRRLTRLEPPFIVSLVFFLFVHVFVLHQDFSNLFDHFTASLFYIHCFVYGEPSIINPVTWSLETEAQFYILVPFLFALLFSKKRRSFSLILSLAFFALSAYSKNAILTNGISHLGYSLLVYFSNFITGIGFAWLFIEQKLFIREKSYFWDVTGLVSTFLLFYFYKPQAEYGNIILFNGFIFLMFVSVFKGKLFNWFYTRPVIYIIGGMCYTIYLLHYALFHLTVKYTSLLSTDLGYVGNYWIQFLINIPLMLTISSLFYLLIEKPCMDKFWPQKLITFIKTKTAINASLHRQ